MPILAAKNDAGRIGNGFVPELLWQASSRTYHPIQCFSTDKFCRGTAIDGKAHGQPPAKSDERSKCHEWFETVSHIMADKPMPKPVEKVGLHSAILPSRKMAVAYFFVRL